MRGMRPALAALSLVTLVCVGYWVWSHLQPPAELIPPPTDIPQPLDLQIAADLQLRAEFKGGGPVTAGAGAWVEVRLVNSSRTVTHRVVKVGHGSEIGYREPYVSWSATIDRGDGKPAPLTDELRYGYCGTCLAFASDWPKDAIWLKPGDHLELDIPQKFEFQQAGRVRLQAHYEYRASGKSNENRFHPDELAFMDGVPPFKLVSNVVEFDVVRPLDVRVGVKRALKVKQKTRLSDLLEVTLVNQSQAPVECSSPTLSANARLSIEIKAEFGGWHPSLTQQATTYGVTRTVKPGESVPLLGVSEFANGLDGMWEYPVTGRVLARAVYTPTSWKYSPPVASEWVEVQVEK